MDRSHLYLAHHGIRGMKWGVRNGPPYPLGESDKSAAEKRAAQGAGRKPNSSKEKFWTDEKKARARKIAIGVAVVAAVGVVSYEAYKHGAFDRLADKGKEYLYGDADGILKRVSTPIPPSETLANVNPLRGAEEGKNNCTSCAVASALQQIFGVRATAISTGGKMQNIGGIIEDCFKGAKVIDGSATSFTSREKASALLVKKFGDNAEGVCGVPFRGGGGHAFNFKIADGVVSFYDGQNGYDDSNPMIERILHLVDPNGGLTIARLDNAEPIPEKIARYVHLED